MKKLYLFLILFFFFLVVIFSATLLIIKINKPGPGPTGFTTAKFSDNESITTLSDGRQLFYVGSFVVEAGETTDKSFNISLES